MLMQPFRAVLALSVAAVLTLRYMSPVLCTTLERDMTLVRSGGDAVVSVDQAPDCCECPTCATAPAAMELSARPALRAVEVSQPELATRVSQASLAPPTHPPEA